MRFLWDYENLTHIAEHGVSPDEAEQALRGRTLDLGYRNWADEERFREAGVTDTGRFLEVISTVRGGDVRVVTAFDASRRAIEEYLWNR